MTTMLAVQATGPSGAVSLTEVDIPRPGPNDVLIRVAAAGLASGMMTMLARGAFRHLPTTLGHEIAGTVEDIGDAVDPALAGARVRVHPNLSCRNCEYCRTDREQMCPQSAMIGHAAFGTAPMPLYERYHDGGMAEYVRVPDWLVDVLPDNVSFAVAAKLQDLAGAQRALKAADLRPGSTVVVTAATGTMGAATARLAPMLGISRLVLVARHADRLDAVAKLASVPTDVVALDDLPADWTEQQGLTHRLRELMPDGADAVIDYLIAGSAAEQALWTLKTGASFVHMGGNPAPLGVPLGLLLARCWRVVGTRSCTRTDSDETLELLTRGLLVADDLLTHRWPLREALTGIETMQTRAEPLLMSVLEP